MEIQSGDSECGLCLLGVSVALVQYCLTVPPFLALEMKIHTLCHCMLEVCDLVFEIDFTGDYSS